ncbi:AAA-like domain-containing protein [Cylindrospermum sp. FACHB-282]|uniref:AAA-like domain-containing protein n=1 Tax=Cylindrospermum sp. FACHB-282 TaxID=2692794 RepID=UPI0016850E86|nr:AAA-like domain-containing protein [Cylindrospermum sp. FACHB-282]MBD2388023.1 AAA-like domain-containing protein [Cylindrospermum sp. FACHB-282]
MSSNSVKNILILAANPLNTDRLRLDKEVEEIRTTLRLSSNRNRFEIESRGAVRPQDLQPHLYNLKPQIVHFSGHGGGEQGLAFEDDDGKLKLVSTSALANLFKLFAHDVECVLLNACYSQVQAEAICQHIPYVIGMNEAIADTAARKFAEGFYRGIWDGRTIENAFASGVNAIALEGIPEELTPVLLKRSALLKLTEPNTDISLESPEGQVRIDSSFYIASNYEERCYEEIKKLGSLIRIKSPHKMGKSSLMVRVLAHAEQLGYRAVALNLQQTNQKFFNDLDKFMQWFCASVGKPLGVQVKVDEYWDDIFGANDNSTDYFEKYLLKENEPPLVIALDNFDRVFKYADIETDFCGLLRGWYERSRSHPLWGKLRLVIVYSQEPYLQKDINQSPFNVGFPIVLSEFTTAQVKELAARHGLAWTDQDIEQLMGLIGGHPYLVRSALYRIASGDVSLEKFLLTAPTEAGIYSSYLLGHLKALEDYPEVGAAMQKVVTSDRPVRLRSEEAFKLDSMGLVVRVENDVIPRCRLYRQYFGDRLGNNE